MDPAIGMVLAAATGALMSYLAVARRLSGKISTSEATDLWAESKSIREWSKERIAELTEEVHALEKRLAGVEVHNDELLNDKHLLQLRVDKLMQELADCRNNCESLHNRLHEHEGGSPDATEGTSG